MGINMTFGIGRNSQGISSGKLGERQLEIACECWFTSKGEARPLMIKFKDEEGQICTVRQICLLGQQKRNYIGNPAIEYHCRITVEGREHEVWLNFFQKECRWSMGFEAGGADACLTDRARV